MIPFPILAIEAPAIIEAPSYIIGGKLNYLLGFRAHGSAESLAKFKREIDRQGWPNIIVDNAGEAPFLSVILKGVSKDAFESITTRSRNGEFGAITFESILLPASGKNN